MFQFLKPDTERTKSLPSALVSKTVVLGNRLRKGSKYSFSVAYPARIRVEFCSSYVVNETARFFDKAYIPHDSS